MAQGYLNAPQLTADKFIANPFSRVSGARLYRTGDLVRYLPDGNLDFLGRLDHQVKVRGFRIELSEIEWTLAQYPDVREAVAVARDEPDGSKTLVAYVVAEATGEPTAPELRSFLKQSQSSVSDDPGETRCRPPAVQGSRFTRLSRKESQQSCTTGRTAHRW